MGLGKLWYQAHKLAREGVTTPYWRDVVRPRILGTPPVRTPSTGECEVHVLTCSNDFLNVLWSLKSLVLRSGIELPVFVHDDGSLSGDQVGEIRRHLPDARFIPRSDSDREVAAALSGLPLCTRFRTTNPLSLKVFDFAFYRRAERYLVIDSDILFFSEMRELARRIGDRTYARNTFNRDWAFGYCVEAGELSRAAGYEVPDRINSGLGIVRAGVVDFAHCEELLSIPGMFGHSHRIEQTLIAASCARGGFEFLPSEYDVRLAASTPAEPCKHYTGPIRHLMYREGMRRLRKLGMLGS